MFRLITWSASRDSDLTAPYNGVFNTYDEARDLYIEAMTMFGHRSDVSITLQEIKSVPVKRGVRGVAAVR